MKCDHCDKEAVVNRQQVWIDCPVEKDGELNIEKKAYTDDQGDPIENHWLCSDHADPDFFWSLM